MVARSRQSWHRRIESRPRAPDPAAGASGLAPGRRTPAVGAEPYEPRVATITALMVCMRFSAWSKTTLAGDSKTS
jgi:hypothetical protein